MKHKILALTLFLISAFALTACAHVNLECIDDKCIDTRAYTGAFDPSQNLTTFYDGCPVDEEMPAKEKVKMCQSSQTFHATGAGAMGPIVGAAGNAGAGVAIGSGLRNQDGGSGPNINNSNVSSGVIRNKVSVSHCQGNCK